ncbi:MAG TPA: hypothetical protein VHF88_07820 [Thermoleophilaceae bacterium]|nr:hypothetical protein [Thermoleophilaceae bacterium]
MRFSKAALLAAIAAAVALAPATPSTADAKPSKRSKAAKPKITRVTPMRIEVGETLVIRGTRFKAKKRRNTIIFRGADGRTAFAKPRRASRRRLVVKVPGSVARLLAVHDGLQRPTRLKLRVLAGRFSAFTPRRLSPVVLGVGSGPGGEGGSGGRGAPTDGTHPLATCDSDADHDDDLLSNADELRDKTDPCLADTDGDGMTDGWEYLAAKDLNIKAVPYPGNRPYPNPLDPSDRDTDFDGDFLPAGIEYRLWRYTGSSFDAGLVGGHVAGSPLGYSDGTQASRPAEEPSPPAFRSPSYGIPFAPPAYPARHVMDHPGPFHAANWTDDERDADSDGVNNYVETAGPGHFSWWVSYLEEASIEPWPDVYFGSFTQRPFVDLAPDDPDVDGDTLLDGEDDQDNDDVLNFDEMYEPGAVYGPDSRQKNAFNPCAPDGESRTCPIYRPF